MTMGEGVEDDGGINNINENVCTWKEYEIPPGQIRQPFHTIAAFFPKYLRV